MIFLTSTSDIIRIVTDAIADVEVHASWANNASGSITFGRTNTASITSATTTTVVSAPAASEQKNVLQLNIRNNHASTAVTITVEHFDGTTAETLIQVILTTNESLILDINGRWEHLDTNGTAYKYTGALASRTDMETGTDLIEAVSPSVQHYHPGACKVWLVYGTSEGNATPLTKSIGDAYNVSGVTDGGKGKLTMTINTDFSSANWICHVSHMRETEGSNLATGNNTQNAIISATQAAGSIQLECFDQTPTIHEPELWFAIGYGTLV